MWRKAGVECAEVAKYYQQLLSHGTQGVTKKGKRVQTLRLGPKIKAGKKKKKIGKI